MVYGPSGSGKSVDALYAFPNGLWAVPTGGQTAAWRKLTGVRPQEVRVNSLAQLTTALRSAGGKFKGKVVVLDDFNVLAERTFQQLTDSGKTGWKLFGELTTAIYRFREALLTQGLSAHITCHERPAKLDDAKQVVAPIRPAMPTDAASTALPHIAQVVTRCVPGGLVVPTELLHRWCYQCDANNADEIGRDRWNVMPVLGPLNIREVLVAAHAQDPEVAVPPRAPGLDWLDTVAEQVATALDSGAYLGRLVQEFSRVAPAGSQPLHWQWALRDGWARHTLRKQDVFAQFTTR